MLRTSVPDGHGPAWLVQAAEIARQFYLEGRSKVEIGDALGMSRFKVARILEEARELGLVEVTLRLPAFIDADTSAAVAAHTGVRAIVLSPDVRGAEVRAELGRLAAALLTERVTDTDTLGLSCSRTVSASCEALSTLAPCEVVQLTGTLAGRDQDPGSVESVRTAAALGGGRAHPIYAPMLLPDAATARALAGQDSISQVLARIGSVTIAMVAVGGWASETSTVWESATPAERKEAKAAGAVGEISGRLFDARGRRVATGLEDRVLGVNLEQLRAIPEVIGLAHGGSRAAAVHAVLCGRLIDTLVCDHELAMTLLDQPPVREAS